MRGCFSVPSPSGHSGLVPPSPDVAGFVSGGGVGRLLITWPGLLSRFGGAQAASLLFGAARCEVTRRSCCELSSFADCCVRCFRSAVGAPPTLARGPRALPRTFAQMDARVWNAGLPVIDDIRIAIAVPSPGGRGTGRGRAKLCSLFRYASISYTPPMPDVERARILRKKETWAEKLLWRWLRDRRFNNYKFRRQHPVGIYYLDFFCEQARLAVELDGFAHGHPDQRRHD